MPLHVSRPPRTGRLGIAALHEDPHAHLVPSSSHQQALVLAGLAAPRHSSVHPYWNLDLEALCGQPFDGSKHDAAVIARYFLEQVISAGSGIQAAVRWRELRRDELDTERPLEADAAGEKIGSARGEESWVKRRVAVRRAHWK